MTVHSCPIAGPVAALLLLTPAVAPSQGPSTDTAAPPLSVALVVSGGASLGVYEAGYLYALGEVLKREGIPVRVATGASAGSGNALFSALTSCGKPNARPTTDLGYGFWFNTRVADLFDPAASTPISAFTARPGVEIMRRLTQEIWERGLPESCDLVLGVPVTRLTPLDVPLRPGSELSAPRQLLRFQLRIRGRGMGRPPLIENVIDRESRMPQLLLPLAPDPDAGWRDDLDRLLQVMVASGAFPVAFPPVPLGYCLYSPAEGMAGAVCVEPEETELFIDGGVFDNVPLRLASSLVARTSEPGTRTLFVYLDPDLRAYPQPAGGDTLAEQPGDVFAYGFQMAFSFVGHARKTELFALLEERPEVLDSVLITTSRYPPASSFLANFFGLFESEFRRFDFYLGISDALHDLEAADDRLPSRRGRRQVEDLWSTPEWRPVRCLRAWVDADRAAADADCAAADLRDLRILAQVAVNRVYSSCRQLSQRQRRSTIAHSHCRRATLDSAPPTIVHDPVIPVPPEAALQQPGEDDLTYNLRLLTAYGFQFRDLGVPPELARRELARDLRAMLHALAARQPERLQRSAVRLAALGAVSPVYYEPPRHWLYFVVGTAQELGVSGQPPGVPDWLRLNGAVRIEGIVSLLTQDPNRFALGVFGGPEFELRPFTRPAYMVTLAGRVGYQFGGGDGFRSAACTAGRARGDGRDCSQVVLQAAAAFIGIERVRFQTTVDFFTQRVDFDDRTYDVHLALGVQF